MDCVMTIVGDPSRGAGTGSRSAGTAAWTSIVLFGMMALLGACRSPEPGGAPDVTEPSHATIRPDLDEPFTLAVGETALLNGAELSVRFRDVPSDSRCPVDVDCVWEGDATAVVETVRGGVRQTHELHLPGESLGPRSVGIDGYRLIFEGLAPEAHSENPIAPGAYRATFRVVAG